MEYLLDTHVCIWALGDKSKLSKRTISILEDKANKLFVSQVSFFEIAIKLQLGKLPDFGISLSEFIEKVHEMDIEILSMKAEHSIAYSQAHFPEEHRDPFDRYLVTAAIYEGLVVITRDEKFTLYGDNLRILW